MKKKIAVLLCIITVLGTGCGKSLEKQIAEQLSMGEKYLFAGDYEAAVIALQKAIELDPQMFDVYVKCAEAYSGMKDYENAIAIFENGVEIVGMENISAENTDFWKELYYDWENWEEEQGQEETVVMDINEKILEKWPDDEWAQEKLKENSEYQRIPGVLASGYYCTYGLREDGTVVAVGNNEKGQCDVSDWSNIVEISASGNGDVYGVNKDGLVVSAGTDKWLQGGTENWTNIKSVSAGGYHVVGLKEDGTVMAAGMNNDGECEVEGWHDMVQVAAGLSNTIGLKSDGTVIAIGLNDCGECDVSDWTDIVAVAAGGHNMIGLKGDGTVVAAGRNEYGANNVTTWTDIIAISAGYYYTVGLKSDGTVVSTGYFGEYANGICEGLENWKDIVAISAGGSVTAGIKADGSSISTKCLDTSRFYYGEDDLAGWTNMKTQWK